MQRKQLLHKPTEPITVVCDMTTDELLSRMENISFQGRQLARAARIWEQAMRSDAYVMMGLAGAMTAGGMGRLVAQLIENRYIDCLVSTGANLFHDIYETLGYHHYLGSPDADDEQLCHHKIDRIYDTYADENQFEQIDRWIGTWAGDALEDRPYSTREFLYELGREVRRKAKGDYAGILSTAAQYQVPVFCPAIGDSSIGIGLAGAKKHVIFDVIADVRDTAQLIDGKDTMVLYCGGGTPKNFIQQTEVTARLLKQESSGHKYAVQFITDAPHWGGLSGCTFEEAVSWGKINPSGEKVTVFCDATIALPIVASAIITRFAGQSRREGA
ncbi:MAG: deoxyhypusine synthase family protein [Candidatus Latescibacterota bacterium]